MYRPLACAVLAAAALAGAVACSGGTPSAAASANAAEARAATVTSSAAASPKTSAEVQCAADLGDLPATAPDTTKQAEADYAALQGQTGSTLASLADAVAADSSAILYDLIAGESDTEDGITWTSDAETLRDYCG